MKEKMSRKTPFGKKLFILHPKLSTFPYLCTKTKPILLCLKEKNTETHDTCVSHNWHRWS